MDPTLDCNARAGAGFPDVRESKRPSGKGPILMLLIAAFIGGLALFLWLVLPSGTTASNSKPPETAPLNASDLRELAELPLVAARLRERLAKSPDDPVGWTLLGRTYARLGDQVNAAGAFEKAVQLRVDDAALLADYADTLAFLNDRSFEGRPQEMIDRALRVDPANSAALMLAGLAAFDRHDYLMAASYWEKVVAALGADNPVTVQALAGIKEAKKRAASL